MPKYKKVKPACSECGWNIDRCTNQDATQREAYPKATRHCNGYRNKPEVASASDPRDSEQPPPKPKDPWDVLKVPLEAKVLVLKDDDIYTVFGAVSGKAEDLVELPMKAYPQGNVDLELAATVLSYFLSPALAQSFAARFTEVIKTMPSEWGITGEKMLEWIMVNAGHDWHQRTISKGTDAGTELPTRCRVCGEAKRPDGVEGPCLGKN